MVGVSWVLSWTELNRTHAQSTENRKTGRNGRGEEKKRLDFSLLASVEDAGRGSESAGSIFSFPRLFSFRLTFRVQ